MSPSLSCLQLAIFENAIQSSFLKLPTLFDFSSQLLLSFNGPSSKLTTLDCCLVFQPALIASFI